MAYDPPTLAELRAKVLRDLRDPNGDTFTTSQVDDFINMGIVELNRARPIETRTEYSGDTDFTTDSIPFNYVFRVDLCRQYNATDTKVWSTLHPSDTSHGYGAAGWEFFGGKLILGGQLVNGIENMVELYTADQVTLAVWGYGDRDLLVGDTDEVADFESGQDELAVRAYAQYAGTTALNEDRALFQQWQTDSNNADVSSTQLQGMQGAAEQRWSRMRSRIFLLRHPATG